MNNDNPVAVLVLPTPPRPGVKGLVDDGPYSSRPALMINSDLHPSDGGGWRSIEPSLFGPRALVLWCRGVVAEGWDRARRAMWAHPNRSTGTWVLASEVDPTVEQAMEFGRLLEQVGLGTVVLLDCVNDRMVERVRADDGRPSWLPPWAEWYEPRGERDESESPGQDVLDLLSDPEDSEATQQVAETADEILSSGGTGCAQCGMQEDLHGWAPYNHAYVSSESRS